MKEIKFRAFDWRNRQMRKGNFFVNFNGDIYEVHTPNAYSKVDHFEVMQYTGLKDKNGREIYEGDILFWEENTPGVIKYKDGSFYFETVDEFYSSWLRVIKHDLESRMEVAGNIYENPNLLGDQVG